MNSDLFILAAPIEDPVKVLFGILFFLIWVAGSAMNHLSKQREQNRREKVRRELESGMPPPPQVRPQARPVQQRTATARPVPRPAARRPAGSPQRGTPSRSPVPIEAMLRQAVPAAKPISQPPPITQAAPARPTRSATADALHSWLRPATLRRQFILTELLQPPLALRDPDASRLI